jgi:hypothetical protein
MAGVLLLIRPPDLVVVQSGLVLVVLSVCDIGTEEQQQLLFVM